MSMNFKYRTMALVGNVLFALGLLIVPLPLFADFVADATYVDQEKEAVPEVLNAWKASTKEWPATVAITRQGGGSCTATFVAEQVLLTAAHCTDDGGKVRIKFRGGLGSTSALCDHHPEYVKQSDNYKTALDFALCKTKSPVKGVGFFEVINTNAVLPARNTDVILLGYGCTDERAKDSYFYRQFGVLHEGRTKLTGKANSGLYFVTEGGAAVCFGDSGGASYMYNSDVSKSQKYIVAVNSRGNIKDHSYLSTTSSASFVNWALAWSAKQQVENICGLHKNAENCRKNADQKAP
ncbi:hypothetical protein NBRC116590_17350 [Pelagimonas sp. KU-00592-HH]|uniref:S1 family peptidase n=1 Tax=Pelagimonas sp. KU-00592-HH TaxID=3127651 RepID=UPI0031088100